MSGVNEQPEFLYIEFLTRFENLLDSYIIGEPVRKIYIDEIRKVIHLQVDKIRLEALYEDYLYYFNQYHIKNNKLDRFKSWIKRKWRDYW